MAVSEKGISTGDMSEALQALVGKDAVGLSAAARRSPMIRRARHPGAYRSAEILFILSILSGIDLSSYV